MGQGNPAITRHPVTPEEAQAKLKKLGIDYSNPRFENICGAKYMAPLYNPATQKPERVKRCVISLSQIVSATISMAPHGHSSPHIPQPLQ